MVLIVDDEPDQCAELAFAVEQLGFRTMCIPTGEEMLGAMLEHSPHMIFLDINLPYRDGIRIAQLAKGINHRARICLLSGNPDRCADARRNAAGVLAVLDKPLSLSDLKHILQPA